MQVCSCCFCITFLCWPWLMNWSDTFWASDVWQLGWLRLGKFKRKKKKKGNWISEHENEKMLHVLSCVFAAMLGVIQCGKTDPRGPVEFIPKTISFKSCSSKEDFFSIALWYTSTESDRWTEMNYQMKLAYVHLISDRISRKRTFFIMVSSGKLWKTENWIKITG